MNAGAGHGFARLFTSRIDTMDDNEDCTPTQEETSSADDYTAEEWDTILLLADRLDAVIDGTLATPA